MSQMRILFILLLIPMWVSSQITFTKVSTLPAIPRVNLVSFLIDNNYYISGGADSIGNILSDVWKCNLNNYIWTKQNECFFGKVFGTGGAAVGQFGIIANELDSQSNNIKQTWKYSPYNDTWTNLPSPPIQTKFSAAFSYHNKFFLCFGLDTMNTHLNTIWAYDTMTSIWSQKASLPASGRDFSSVAVADSFAYFAGGRDSNYNSLTELWQYNIIQDSWLQLPNIPGLSRFGTMIYAYRNFILVGFGFHNTMPNIVDHPVTGFYKLDLSNLQWTPISYTGIDTPIGSEYTCFQYNRKCFVYGRYRSSNSYYNDLWMFDPAPLHPVYEGVEEIPTPTAISLRPNPATETCTIEIDASTGVFSAVLLDIAGREIGALGESRGSRLIFPVSQYAKGVYLVRISSEQGMTVLKKLVIE